MSAAANYVKRTIELGLSAVGPDGRGREGADLKAELERINGLAVEAGLIARKQGVNDTSKYRRWLRGNFRVGSAVSLGPEARAEVIRALERLIAEQGA